MICNTDSAAFAAALLEVLNTHDDLVEAFNAYAMDDRIGAVAGYEIYCAATALEYGLADQRWPDGLRADIRTAMANEYTYADLLAGMILNVTPSGNPTPWLAVHFAFR